MEGKLENRVEMSAYKEYLAYTATAEYDYADTTFSAIRQILSADLTVISNR